MRISSSILGSFVLLISLSEICSLAFPQTRVGIREDLGRETGILGFFERGDVDQSVKVKRLDGPGQASESASCTTECGVYLQTIFNDIAIHRSKAPSFTNIPSNSTTNQAAILVDTSTTNLKAPANNLAPTNDTLLSNLDTGMRFWCTDTAYLASLLLCYYQHCPEELEPQAWKQLNGTCSGAIPPVYVFRNHMMQNEVVEIVNFQELESSKAKTVRWHLDELAYGLCQPPVSHLKEDAFSKILIWVLYAIAGTVLFTAAVYTAISILRTESIDFHEIKHVENQSSVSRRTYTTALSVVGTRSVKIWTSFRRKFILPAAFGEKHIEPVGWCTIPTRVQFSAIIFLFLINGVFLIIDHRGGIVNFSGTDSYRETIRYVADRAGFLALANLPIVFLTAGRNNFLIRMTKFSYGVFNVFHKWVARIATILAILHSILYTIYKYPMHGADSGLGIRTYNLEYWKFGIAATVVMTAMITFAIYPIRRKYYELFLFGHIVGTALFIYTLLRHLQLSKSGAYYPWIWACIAFWAFDRFARFIRILVLNTYRGKFSKHEAKVKLIKNTDIMKVSVYPSKTGVGFFPGAHYFLYIRSNKYWKFWESHPFTAVNWRERGSEFINTNCKAKHRPPWKIQRKGGLNNISGSVRTREDDWEKAAVLNYGGDGLSTIVEKSTLSMCKTEDMKPSRAKITFLIRKQDGMTGSIFKELGPDGRTTLDCMIEGPYGSKHDLHIYDTVVTIAGGIGVSTTLAYLYDHLGRVKRGETMTKRFVFIWSVKHEEMIKRLIKDSGLAKAIQDVNDSSGTWVDLKLFVTGQRVEEAPIALGTEIQNSRKDAILPPQATIRESEDRKDTKKKESRPGTAGTVKGSPRQHTVGSRGNSRRSPSKKSRPNTASSRPNTSNGRPGTSGSERHLTVTNEPEVDLEKPPNAYLRPGSSKNRPGTSGGGNHTTSDSLKDRPGTSGSSRPRTSGSSKGRPGTSGSTRPRTSGSLRDRPGTSDSARPSTSGSYNRPSTSSTRPSTGTSGSTRPGTGSTGITVPTTISERPEVESTVPGPHVPKPVSSPPKPEPSPPKPERKRSNSNQGLSKKKLLEKQKEERYPSVRIENVRPNIKGLLQMEMKFLCGKMAVVACGPGRMMDSTRKAVVEALGRVGRRGDKEGANRVQYYEEAFGW